MCGFDLLLSTLCLVWKLGAERCLLKICPDCRGEKVPSQAHVVRNLCSEVAVEGLWENLLKV